MAEFDRVTLISRSDRDALARWGRPTITPIPVNEGLPEPVGPTDEELDSVFYEHCWTENDLMDHDDFVKAARAVLARWVRPAIAPIPVSERLGPEDCDAEGKGWWAWGNRRQPAADAAAP